MQVVHTPEALRAALDGRGRTGFVPTMGNLHAGHLALVGLAREHADTTVASIFVNPLQFGEGEDFERYPRTLAADCAALEAAGCNLVFAPDVATLYPEPQTFLVEPPAALVNDLCGAHRPGHFAGVATVVLKLFHLVRPDVAVFGKKDWQQLAVIRGLVRQFNLGIDIVGGETVRADDGLALSSRNQYLSADERVRAPQLARELEAIAHWIESGRRDWAALEHDAIRHLRMAGWDVDYVAVRHADTLAAPDESTRDLVALAAARLGATRLIDNREIRLG